MSFKRTWEGIKIDKITEEVLTSLINKLEKFDERLKALENGRIPPKSQTNHGVKSGMATENQLNYIKGLGGDPWPEITKQEAGELIEELKKEKEKKKSKSPTGGPAGHALMSPEIKDASRDHEIKEETKSLTEDEIEELEKEGALL